MSDCDLCLCVALETRVCTLLISNVLAATFDCDMYTTLEQNLSADHSCLGEEADKDTPPDAATMISVWCCLHAQYAVIHI